ncbi:MAG: helix-turn-helix transcriptional regulator [Deltaproteobacteria bacterium]|jgi:HTH-type transcriptional regulator / antitoxin HipB|nr:helix-turn-helix transcriptional regulator [Deltaproteobacteria bacterium]
MEHWLTTPNEVAKILADRHKNLRLSKKWKRTTLSNRSGVSVASLIRFEQTAQISLENFLKLLFALGRLDEVDDLLQSQVAKSIDDLENQVIKNPKRGSI